MPRLPPCPAIRTLSRIGWLTIFTAERIQYIILTNSASLYSVILYGRGITDSDIFIDRALSALAEHMRDAGHGAIFDSCIAPLTGEIVFSKTGDRQVMGSVNDHVQRAQIHFEIQEESPHTVSLKLNGTPMSALDYRYPREALTKLSSLPEPEKETDCKIIPFPRKS